MDDRVEMVFREDLFQRRVIADVGLDQEVSLVVDVIGDVCALDLRVVKFIEIIHDDDPGGALR